MGTRGNVLAAVSCKMKTVGNFHHPRFCSRFECTTGVGTMPHVSNFYFNVTNSTIKPPFADLFLISATEPPREKKKKPEQNIERPSERASKRASRRASKRGEEEEEIN